MTAGVHMDIKKNIADITDKVKNDKDFQKELKKDPIKAVEKATGIDLPDEKIEKAVEVAKDKIGDAVEKKFKK